MPERSSPWNPLKSPGGMPVDVKFRGLGMYGGFATQFINMNGFHGDLAMYSGFLDSYVPGPYNRQMAITQQSRGLDK
jgi:hypothetical protein